jgi:ABC-type glycerol-3-phosphate transport system substrate-binding protein
VLVVDWASARVMYQNIWGSDMVDIAPLPRLTRASGQDPALVRVPIHSEVLVLNPTSEAPQKQAALDFARWLVSPEAQRRLLELPAKQPVNNAVDLSAHPLNARLRAVAEAAGEQVPPSYALEQSWLTLQNMVRRVLQNQNEPVEDEVDRTVAQICATPGLSC